MHLRAENDHLQCLLCANYARQPLCSTGAGHETKIDFRQAETRGRHCDSVVGNQRKLEPAAERRAMNRSNHWLGTALDESLHIPECRLRRPSRQFGNIGAGEKGAAGAQNHD
jgi:hypothetical protein